MAISRVAGAMVAAGAAIGAGIGAGILYERATGGIDLRVCLGAALGAGLGVLWAADKFGLIAEPYRQSSILHDDDDRPFVTGNTPIEPR